MKNLNEYEGHWITTFTGKKFHFLENNPDEIDIVDIAHALAFTCRFGGHVNRFYSVAEHCIRVAEIVPAEQRLSALLHDAHEAYLHDVPRPIKIVISGYKEIADRIQATIDRKFGTCPTPEIKHADDVLLATEARDLKVGVTDWAALPAPLRPMIFPIQFDFVSTVFLSKFVEYSNG